MAAKHPAEDADREEEPRPASDPMRPVGSESSSGHDAMDVGVMLQVLAPSVEDGKKADLDPEMLGVGGDPTKGLGGGLKEEAVDHPGVLEGDRAEGRPGG